MTPTAMDFHAGAGEVAYHATGQQAMLSTLDMDPIRAAELPSYPDEGEPGHVNQLKHGGVELGEVDTRGAWVGSRVDQHAAVPAVEIPLAGRVQLAEGIYGVEGRADAEAISVPGFGQGDQVPFGVDANH